LKRNYEDDTVLQQPYLLAVELYSSDIKYASLSPGISIIFLPLHMLRIYMYMNMNERE